MKRLEHVKTTETGQHAFRKFIFVLLIFILYAAFVVNKYGAKEGLLIAFLTWSFFVYCTPIADAGFLLAFPIRLVSDVRMVYTQVIAYFIALAILAYAMLFSPAAFERTILLRLFKEIILHPWPYWIILILSMIGTFASIVFADELMDVATHRERKHFHAHFAKYEFIATLALIGLTLALYKLLIDQLNIPISLF